MNGEAEIGQDSGSRAASLDDIGYQLFADYKAHGDPGRLEAAIEAWRQALALTPPDSPDRAAPLNNLGSGLRTRYERAGRPGDLDEAIELSREAVALTPPDSPDRAGRLSNLGGGLRTRYERAGRPADLDEAIELSREALALTPPDSPDRARRLNNLGIGLRTRYERDGRPADLDEAIERGREAVALTPPDSPDRASLLSNLGTGLQARYERDGRPADLDEAIELSREAVALTPPDSPDRATLLSNLGLGLQTRYERDGRAADLDEAIELSREALALTPPDSPDRAGRLSNLGSGLQTRYERAGRPADLDEAIERGREALALTPPDSPDRATLLSNLGLGLQTRYERDGRAADLDEAIELWREAVALTPPDSPDRAARLSNLGNGLGNRYERDGRASDLDEALGMYALALRMLPEGSPFHRAISTNHRIALSLRTARGGSTALEAILGGVKTAIKGAPAHEPAAGARLGLVYAGPAFRQGLWAKAAGLYGAAFQAREIALGEMEQTAPAETARGADGVPAGVAALYEDRLGFLRAFANAGANAALALLRAGGQGAAEQAALAMELGLQQSLQESFDLIEIDLLRHRATGRPGADRFRNARARLATLTRAAVKGGAGAPSAQALQAARDEFGLAIAEIQAAPGFEQFLRPVDTAAIRQAAASSSVVYLGATEHGGLALIVPDAEAPVIPVDLPDLTTPVVQDIAEPYEQARAGISDDRPIRPWLDRLDATLRALWPVAMERLCAELQERGLTRAVLIPYGGTLASLPWHAAWTVGAGRQDGRRYACDGITWRYAPSARLSGPPRQWPPRRGRAEEALVVYHADSPGDPEQEAAAIRAALGAITVVSGRKATPENVRRAWQAARYAHLDVHGHADTNEPLKSCLVLAGERELSIRDLLSEPQPLPARLCVLAACSTAVTSGRQGVDEVVSWPAALMRAGVGQVMASSWPVWDAATVPLMRGFYERLGRDEGADLAEALQASARAIRGGGMAELAPAPVAGSEPFWRRMMGGLGGKAEPVAAGARMRQRAGHRMKRSAPDSTVTDTPADPDTAPANWNHPHFWAGFCIHGTEDSIVR